MELGVEDLIQSIFDSCCFGHMQLYMALAINPSDVSIIVRVSLDAFEEILHMQR